mgnify:CR=1 FL=1
MSILGAADKSDAREIRAVVVSPGREVLWADLTRGRREDMNAWVSERLFSGLLPGAPQLQQLGPFAAEHVTACPMCNSVRFPIDTKSCLVCPRCNRHAGVPLYATQAAR